MIKLLGAVAELVFLVVLLLVRLFITNLLRALIVAGVAYLFTLVLVNMFSTGHLLDYWATAKILLGVFFAFDFMFALYRIGKEMG